MRISEVCSPLWACLRVLLLIDYVGDMYHRVDHLPVTQQIAALMEK